MNLTQYIEIGCSRMAAARINPKPHSAALIPAFERFEINTPDRVAAALAQFAHETGGFRWLRELGGARYFATRYDSRKDLGNLQPGDGARFRGRGYIQITGRANYARMATATGYPLLARPELAEDPDVAALISSCWWQEHGLNELADQRRIKAITRIINGGLNGYEDRKLRYGQLLALQERLG
jgi:putative chitinase